MPTAEHNDYYPKLEYSQDGNFKDTYSIPDLSHLKIWCMSMQECMNARILIYNHVFNRGSVNARGPVRGGGSI